MNKIIWKILKAEITVWKMGQKWKMVKFPENNGMKMYQNISRKINGTN